MHEGYTESHKGFCVYFFLKHVRQLRTFKMIPYIMFAFRTRIERIYLGVWEMLNVEILPREG